MRKPEIIKYRHSPLLTEHRLCCDHYFYLTGSKYLAEFSKIMADLEKTLEVLAKLSLQDFSEGMKSIVTQE